ncbi:hypothetical protein GCM10026986_22700 [Nitrincola alkalisediminis]
MINCQVSSEEMNESKPSMKCRYVKMLSKLGNERLPRASGYTWLCVVPPDRVVSVLWVVWKKYYPQCIVSF